MDLLHEWMSPQGVIALGVVVGIIQQFRAWRDSRARGAILLRHAEVTAGAIAGVAHEMKALEVNTNNKMDLLLASKDAEALAQVGRAGAEGELRGRAGAAEDARNPPR